MRKNLLKVVTAVGMSMFIATGCSGNGSNEVTTNAAVSNGNTTVSEKETSQTAGEKETESDDMYKETWKQIWPGSGREVELRAATGIISGFVADGNKTHVAVNYAEDIDIGEQYCYYFYHFLKKGEPIYEKSQFPENIEDVPDDIWENEWSIWGMHLKSSNGGQLPRSGEFTREVLKTDIIEINEKKFLREEMVVKSVDNLRERETHLVTYYYQTEDGHGMCVFGDRSEEQQMFEVVKEVADIIMGTYRER